jgi:hypothetical protein
LEINLTDLNKENSDLKQMVQNKSNLTASNERQHGLDQFIFFNKKSDSTNPQITATTSHLVSKQKNSFFLEKIFFEELDIESCISIKTVSFLISQKVVSFFLREKNVCIKEKSFMKRNYGIYIRYHCSLYFRIKSVSRKNYQCKKTYAAHYLFKTGDIFACESSEPCLCE